MKKTSVRPFHRKSKADKNLRLTQFVAASLGLAVAGLSTQTAHAQTTWTGATDQDWSKASNWTNGVPTDGDTGNNTAFINTDTGNFPIFDSGDTSTTDWDVFVGSSANGRLDQTGGTLTIGNPATPNWMFVGSGAATGTYNLSGDASLSSGALNIGAWNGDGANGTVNMASTGTITTVSNISGIGASLLVGEAGGSGSVGTLNQSSGTINAGVGAQFGRNSGNTGNYNMTGGTLNVAGELIAGANGGTGNLDISGGTVNVDSWVLGSQGVGVGTITISGSGVLNQGLTNAGSRIELGNPGATGSATFNLNGGTVVTNGFVQNGGTGTLNFNGGTIRARADNANFITGLSNAIVGAGGATVDNNGFAITINQELTSGSSGAGTLTFTGSGTTLLTSGSIGAVSVANGTGFGAATTTGSSTLTATTLNMGTGGTTTFTFNFGDIDITPTAPLMDIGTINATGTVNFAFTGGGALPQTDFALVHYGTLNGAGSLVLGNYQLAPRATADLVNTGTSLNLTNVTVNTIRWNGGVNSDWDIDTTANFTTVPGGASTTYFQGAGTGTDSTVTFNDLAVNTTVNIVADVSPTTGVIVTGTKTYTFEGSGAIVGAGSLTKSGAGTLIIDNTGTNNYSGGTIIEAGTVRLGDNINLGDDALSGALTMNGGTLDFNGWGTTLSSLSGSGGVITNGFSVPTVLIVNQGGDTNFGGVIEDGSGGGGISLTKTGGGSLTLSGSNTYSGETLVDGAVAGGDANRLTVGADGALSPNSVVTLNGNGKLELNGHTATVAGLRTGPDGTANIVQNLEAAGSGTGTLIINAAGGESYLFDGIIRDRTGVLAMQKSGAGTQILSNKDPNVGVGFTGGLTVSGGTFILQDLGTAANGQGKTIDSFASNIVNNATLGLATLTGGNTQTLKTAISGSGNVLITGSNLGTVVLAGSNTYTGSTTVNSGTVGFSTSPSSIGSVTVQNGTGLKVKAASAGSTLLTTTSLTLGSGSSLAFDFNGLATTAPIITTTGAFTASGAINVPISGIGGLTSGSSYTLVSYSSFAGGGTFTGSINARNTATLSNTNNALTLVSWTNVTPVWTGSDSGTWAVGMTGANGNWRVDGTQTDYMVNDFVRFDDTATGTTVDISTADVSPFSVTFENSTKDYTLSGGFGIAGSTGITKSGTGKLTISATNTYTGATTINDGTVSISANNNLGADGAPVILNGGTLQTTNTTPINQFLHPITVGASGGTLFISGTGPESRVRIPTGSADRLLGSGSLTVMGTGTLSPTTQAGVLVITNSNSYIGNITVVDGGDVEWDNATAVSAAATFTVGNNGGISVANGQTMPNAITVSGTGGVLAFNNNSNGTYSGSITLNQDVSFGLRNWYDYNAAIGGTVSGVISGVGGITAARGTAGTATLTLNNVNTYTGNTAIGVGATLAVSGSGQLGSGSYAGTISNAGTLNIGTSANQTLSGVISGAGALVKSGSGTLTLSAANSYTGTTTVDGGRLLLSGSTSRTGTGLTTVNTGATLGGTGSVQGALVANASSTVSPGLSAGTLTVGGSATFNGDAKLSIELGGTSGQDRLNVVGATTLSGSSQLQLAFLGESNPANLITSGTYTVLNSSALTGTFASATNLGVYDDGGGVTYTGTSVQVVLTKDLLGGDANLDGTTNGLDLNILGGSWLGSANWVSGDFNGDGVANGLDLNILGGEWLNSAIASNSGGGSGGTVSAIPEPSSAMLLLTGSALWLLRRRRRGSSVKES